MYAGALRRRAARTADLNPRRDTAKQRRTFEQVRRAENSYARGLRGIARHVGEIARGFAPDDPEQVSEMERMLRSYSEFIGPWAQLHAQRMLAEVGRRDEAVWAEIGRDMGRALREEIKTAPTGELLRGLLAEQVWLIKSLPLEAAQRVHRLAVERLSTSGRAGEVAKQIMRTGEVTINRANLIARTEVARASSGLVEARALHVGSDGYIWETARDADVRKSHREMQGKFVRWDQPPDLDNLTGHAGQLPNCRCWPRPIFPEEP